MDTFLLKFMWPNTAETWQATQLLDTIGGWEAGEGLCPVFCTWNTLNHLFWFTVNLLHNNIATDIHNVKM